MPTLLRDPFRKWLFAGAFVYAWVLTQGIPLWDDDFTSWFWKIQDRGLPSLLWEWISPISTQPEYWGFNERPLQKLVYKITYLISGYESWSYLLFKNAVLAGCVAMIDAWGSRLLPEKLQGTRVGRIASLLAGVFFLLAPGTIAAQVMLQDFAPVAELIFLCLAYVIWEEIEKTPQSWKGFPAWSDPEHRRWMGRWALISALTYLGYKSKADLKLIPAILAAYALLVRRGQLAFFAVPVGLMGLLAVPWGGSVFRKLPPFIPGSRGSEIGWMWQPASWERLREYFWSSQGYDWLATLREPTISLAAVLGPFVLLPLAAFAAWKLEDAAGKRAASRKAPPRKADRLIPWLPVETRPDRARAFALIWLCAVIAGISALPALNYIFRVRYGILPMVPVSILLAWAFGSVVEAIEDRRFPRWVAPVAVGLLAIQCSLNLVRSVRYRHSMGEIMIAVDRVYERFARDHGGAKLTLLPDFRPYDYRPDAPASIHKKDWLSSSDDLVKKGYQPGETFVISWSPSLWHRLELVERLEGCRPTTLLDRLYPCERGNGAYLMRFIDDDPLYAQGEALRSKGDVAGALRKHEEFLAKHPRNLAGYFVVGLEAYQLGDWERARQAYAELEQYLPKHLSIVYNHALALEELKRYPEAIERHKFIVEREPRNYAALLHLYWSYRHGGQAQGAEATLKVLKREFPEDAEINRILRGGT